MIQFDARKFAAACLVASTLGLTACGDSSEKYMAASQAAYDKHDLQAATIQIKNALQKKPDSADARLLFGRILTAQGDSVGAEREYRKALEYGSKEDLINPLLINALVGQGKAKTALTEFAGKQPALPEDKADLAVAMGNAYLASGDVAAAEKQFASAMGLKPGSFSAQLGLVKIKMASRDFDGAIALLDSAIRSQPKLSEAVMLKGEVLSMIGKRDEAIAVFKSAAANDPDDKAPLVRLISLYLQAGKPAAADASKTLEALRKLAPNDMRTVYFDGVIALDAGKFPEAREFANKVLRANPDHEMALMLAASANLSLGDTVQAEAQLSKVVTTRKDWALPRRMLAQTYVNMRDADRALETLKPLLAAEATANDPDVLSLAGQIYMMTGDFAKSTDYFSKVANLRPNSEEARTRLGVSRMAAGDEMHAMQDLEAVANRDGGSLIAEVAIVANLLKKGDIDKAQKSIERLEKQKPDNPATYMLKAYVLSAAKNTAGARQALEKALSLQPGNVGAATELARLDLAEGKPAEARQRFEKIIKAEPKNLQAHLRLAQLLRESGASTADVRAALDKAVAVDPSRNEARQMLVQVLMRDGDVKQALVVAQQAQAAAPQSMDALRLLGATQMATGDKQQAVVTFGKVQAADPKNPASLMDLAVAQNALGDTAAAEKSLRHAIELRPDYAEAYQQLVGLLIKARRTPEALRAARDLQGRKPDLAAGYLLEAEAYATDNQWADVYTAMQKAYQRAKTPQVVLGMRTAAIKLGKLPEAQKLAADWLKANPKDSIVRVQLADEALTAGKYAEALDLYKTVNGFTPGNPIVLNNLAWVANKQNDPKVLEYAEQALKAAPKVAGVMETVGTILVERGQAPRGLAMLKEAVGLAPKAAAVRLGYARALARTGDKTAAAKEARDALEGLEEPKLRKEIEDFAKTL